MNYNDINYQKEKSTNYNSSNVSDSENAFNYNGQNCILRNYNSYNSHGRITNKYYELNNEQRKPNHKVKTKPISLNGNNFYNNNTRFLNFK